MALEDMDRARDVLKERIKSEVSYFDTTATPDTVTVIYRGASYNYRRSREDLAHVVPNFPTTPRHLREAGLTSSHLAAFAEVALQAMDRADEDTQIDRSA